MNKSRFSLLLAAFGPVSAVIVGIVLIAFPDPTPDSTLDRLSQIIGIAILIIGIFGGMLNAIAWKESKKRLELDYNKISKKRRAIVHHARRNESSYENEMHVKEVQRCYEDAQWIIKRLLALGAVSVAYDFKKEDFEYYSDLLSDKDIPDYFRRAVYEGIYEESWK